MRSFECSFPGCGPISYRPSKGLCSAHYQQQRKGLELTPKRQPVPLRDCSFLGCHNTAEQLGLCCGHYSQRRRGRDLTPLRPRRKSGTFDPKAETRAYGLQRRYQMSTTEYDALLAAQGGACAVCREVPAPNTNLMVDHDHACCDVTPTCGNCNRGLLCQRCNTGLGYFRDSAEFLRSAAQYVCDTGAKRP